MIAAFLALVAAVLLAVGFLADLTALGWAAVAVALAAVVLVVLPRRSTADREPDVEPFETVAAQPPQEPPFETVAAQPPQEPPAESPATADLVLVTPGRHRYHRPGCELLADREVEQLTEAEAREEGFSACTHCNR